MATANIELRARTKRLESSLRRVRRGLTGVGAQADVTNVKVQGLSRAGRLLKVAFAGIGFAFVVRSLINVGKEFEILTARLSTFEGSTQAAGEALSRLNTVAQTTPFQLQDVVNSFIQLRSAGLQPTNRELVALGNVAAAFGQTMNQVANVVFRGAASTELFYNLGITARKEGDKLRVTYDGVTKTIEATNAGIQAYLVSLGETRFAGAALEQAKGLTAAFSNFSGNLQFTIDRLGNASGAFQRISVVMNSLSGDLISLGENAEEIFGGAFDTRSLIAFELRIAKIRIQIATFYDDIVGIFGDNALAQTALGGLLFGTKGASVAIAANFDIPGLRGFIQNALDTDEFTANIVAELTEVVLSAGLIKTIQNAPLIAAVIAQRIALLANTTALIANTTSNAVNTTATGVNSASRAIPGIGGSVAATAAWRAKVLAALASSGPIALAIAATVGGVLILDTIADEGEEGTNRRNLTQTVRDVDKEAAELTRLYMSGAELTVAQQAAYDAQLQVVLTLTRKMNELIAKVEETAPGTSDTIIAGARRLTVNTGGSVSGPGSGTSDSIPALLSNGEYVIRASQASKYGSLLDNINNGTQGFAAGGLVGKYQAGGRVTGAGSGFFEDFDLSEFTEEQVVLLENLQDELKYRRENRQVLVDLLATQEEGTAAYKSTQNEIDKTNRLLAGTEQNMVNLADSLVTVDEAIKNGFFSEKEVTQIAGDLAKGISGVLSGKSDESIATVFKRAAVNYLQKQLESTLNDLFTTVLSNVGEGGSSEGNIFTTLFGAIFGGSFHDGGVVPGRPGQEVPILAMAGETITPAGQSPDGGGTTIIINQTINAPTEVGPETRRLMADEAKRAISSNPELVNGANNLQRRRNRTFGGT